MTRPTFPDNEHFSNSETKQSKHLIQFLDSQEKLKKAKRTLRRSQPLGRAFGILALSAVASAGWEIATDNSVEQQLLDGSIACVVGGLATAAAVKAFVKTWHAKIDIQIQHGISNTHASDAMLSAAVNQQQAPDWAAQYLATPLDVNTQLPWLLEKIADFSTPS